MGRAEPDSNFNYFHCDDPVEVAKLMPAGSRFYHPVFGKCVSVGLEVGRSVKYWYLSYDPAPSLKVFNGDHTFRCKVVQRVRPKKWPDPDDIDCYGKGS